MVERIRRQVDLPAPFGPSRAVTLPSAAWNETLRTACTAPKDLTSPFHLNHGASSVAPAIKAHRTHQIEKKRRVRKAIDAPGIQRFQVAGVDELCGQPREAAAPDHAVPLTVANEMQAVRQALHLPCRRTPVA